MLQIESKSPNNGNQMKKYEAFTSTKLLILKSYILIISLIDS